MLAYQNHFALPDRILHESLNEVYEVHSAITVVWLARDLTNSQLNPQFGGGSGVPWPVSR